MNSNEISSSLVEQYQKLLKLLDCNLKYLEGLKFDPDLLKSYRQLLRYLRTHPDQVISEILVANVPKKASAAREELKLSDEQVRALTGKEISLLISDSKITRKQLERIAIVRFGVTKGGLSVLRNRDALAEKLSTLVANEDTHNSITRIAEKGRSGE